MDIEAAGSKYSVSFKENTNIFTSLFILFLIVNSMRHIWFEDSRYGEHYTMPRLYEGLEPTSLKLGPKFPL